METNGSIVAAESGGGIKFAGGFQEVTLEDGTKDYQYVGSYEYESRQFTQSEVNYTPVSGSSGDGRACSSCRWFVSPARCALVAGEIAPNGLSDLWTAQPVYTREPIPVVIVGGDKQNDILPSPRQESAQEEKKSIVKRVTDWVVSVQKSLSGGATLGGVQTPAGLQKAFSIKEMDDGTIRWFAHMSNNFQDREGETFTEESHKEFVDWAESTGSYPELWLWHIPGSKFGSTDWMDVSSGFVHATGVVDNTVEAKALAKSLAESGEELGTSHGFICLKTKSGTIVKYRSKELSVLPLERAANGWTAFHFNLLQEKAMPFSEARKSFLQTKGVSADDIAQWEKNTDALSESLKAHGVEFKSILEENEGEVNLATEVSGLVKAFGDTLAKFDERVKSLETLVGEAKTLAQKSKDDIVSDEYLARIAGAMGNKAFRATGDTSTEVGAGDVELTTGAKSNNGGDWMDKQVWGPMGLGSTVPTS